MGRLGLYPALIIVVFGVVAPFFIFKLGRLIGFAPLLVLAFALGLAYGAVKAEYPWVANGLIGNVAFMAASTLVLVAYAAISYSVGGLIDKTMATLRRE
ncbi:MAG: hypothetical protein JOY52_00185 [Hyphomicrobiales bacterium]|nr:hypothetical protein [Hyphomicrobiales bacterium]